MSSPAKRRRDRLSRKRRDAQLKARVERVADELRNHWKTQIVRPEYVPNNLRDITPSRLITASTPGASRA